MRATIAPDARIPTLRMNVPRNSRLATSLIMFDGVGALGLNRSTQQRAELLRRGVEGKRGPLTVVQRAGDLVHAAVWNVGEIRRLGEVLMQEPVRLHVGAPLPRALRITEVHRDVVGHREGVMRGHFLPAVLRQCLAELRR